MRQADGHFADAWKCGNSVNQVRSPHQHARANFSFLPCCNRLTSAFLVQMLVNAAMVMKLLPSNAVPVVILVTDGVVVEPPPTSYESILLQFCRHDIVCHILPVDVGDVSQQACSAFGYVPDIDILKTIAITTGGKILGRVLGDKAGSTRVSSKRRHSVSGAAPETRSHSQRAQPFNHIQHALLWRESSVKCNDEQSARGSRFTSQFISAVGIGKSLPQPYRQLSHRPRWKWYQTHSQHTLKRTVVKSYDLVGVRIRDVLWCRLTEGFSVTKIMHTFAQSSSTSAGVSRSGSGSMPPINPREDGSAAPVSAVRCIRHLTPAVQIEYFCAFNTDLAEGRDDAGQRAQPPFGMNPNLDFSAFIGAALKVKIALRGPADVIASFNHWHKAHVSGTAGSYGAQNSSNAMNFPPSGNVSTNTVAGSANLLHVHSGAHAQPASFYEFMECVKVTDQILAQLHDPPAQQSRWRQQLESWQWNSRHRRQPHPASHGSYASQLHSTSASTAAAAPPAAPAMRTSPQFRRFLRVVCNSTIPIWHRWFEIVRFEVLCRGGSRQAYRGAQALRAVIAAWFDEEVQSGIYFKLMDVKQSFRATRNSSRDPRAAHFQHSRSTSSLRPGGQKPQNTEKLRGKKRPLWESSPTLSASEQDWRRVSRPRQQQFCIARLATETKQLVAVTLGFLNTPSHCRRDFTAALKKHIRQVKFTKSGKPILPPELQQKLSNRAASQANENIDTHGDVRVGSIYRRSLSDNAAVSKADGTILSKLVQESSLSGKGSSERQNSASTGSTTAASQVIPPRSFARSVSSPLGPKTSHESGGRPIQVVTKAAGVGPDAGGRARSRSRSSSFGLADTYLFIGAVQKFSTSAAASVTRIGDPSLEENETQIGPVNRMGLQRSGPRNGRGMPPASPLAAASPAAEPDALHNFNLDAPPRRESNRRKPPLGNVRDRKAGQNVNTTASPTTGTLEALNEPTRVGVGGGTASHDRPLLEPLAHIISFLLVPHFRRLYSSGGELTDARKPASLPGASEFSAPYAEDAQGDTQEYWKVNPVSKLPLLEGTLSLDSNMLAVDPVDMLEPNKLDALGPRTRKNGRPGLRIDSDNAADTPRSNFSFMPVASSSTLQISPRMRPKTGGGRSFHEHDSGLLVDRGEPLGPTAAQQSAEKLRWSSVGSVRQPTQSSTSRGPFRLNHALSHGSVSCGAAVLPEHILKAYFFQERWVWPDVGDARLIQRIFDFIIQCRRLDGFSTANRPSRNAILMFREVWIPVGPGPFPRPAVWNSLGSRRENDGDSRGKPLKNESSTPRVSPCLAQYQAVLVRGQSGGIELRTEFWMEPLWCADTSNRSSEAPASASTQLATPSGVLGTGNTLFTALADRILQIDRHTFSSTFSLFEIMRHGPRSGNPLGRDSKLYATQRQYLSSQKTHHAVSGARLVLGATRKLEFKVGLLWERVDVGDECCTPPFELGFQASEQRRVAEQFATSHRHSLWRDFVATVQSICDCEIPWEDEGVAGLQRAEDNYGDVGQGSTTSGVNEPKKVFTDVSPRAFAKVLCGSPDSDTGDEIVLVVIVPGLDAFDVQQAANVIKQLRRAEAHDCPQSAVGIPVDVCQRTLVRKHGNYSDESRFSTRTVSISSIKCAQGHFQASNSINAVRTSTAMDHPSAPFDSPADELSVLLDETSDVGLVPITALSGPFGRKLPSRRLKFGHPYEVLQQALGHRPFSQPPRVSPDPPVALAQVSMTATLYVVPARQIPVGAAAAGIMPTDSHKYQMALRALQQSRHSKTQSSAASGSGGDASPHKVGSTSSGRVPPISDTDTQLHNFQSALKVLHARNCVHLMRRLLVAACVSLPPPPTLLEPWWKLDKWWRPQRTSVPSECVLCLLNLPPAPRRIEIAYRALRVP